MIARAASAPLLAIYLSMARALPITSRDILHQAELAQGIQLVRDVVRVAQDPAAALADKMQLYEASAEMHPRDRQRLAQMIAVVNRRLGGQVGGHDTLPTLAAAAVVAPVAEAFPLAGPGETPPRRLDAVDALDDALDGDEPLNGLGPMPTGRYSGRRLMERVEATR